MVTSSPISAVSPMTVKPWSMKNLGAGVNIDRGDGARKMIHQPRQEVELAAVKPVRNPVQA
jgi:hypothetical protein